VSVSAPSTDWICTGLHWIDGEPTLIARRGEDEHKRVLHGGVGVSWRWSGPRRCTGWWAPATGRRPCPRRAVIDARATMSQCPLCQSRDAGLALARDRIVDDGKEYQLYLAWFAPGMLKVGLTAVSRGNARLLEQAAIGYTIIATGSLPSIRRAELTLSHSGLATERVRARAKAESWWRLADAASSKESELADARSRALRILAGHDLNLLVDGPIIDNTSVFGLALAVPTSYQEITALADEGRLTATVREPIGKHVFMDTAIGPGDVAVLLLDTRLLAGHSLSAVSDPEPDSGHVGLHLVERRRPELYDAPTLF
jgi:Protein of unknown function (DUF2797)